MKNVKITCRDGRPQTTEIIDSETGNEIHSVAKVEIEINPDEARAVLHLNRFDAEWEGKTKAEMECPHCKKTIKLWDEIP